MKINSLEINADIYQVMDKLREQLRQNGSTLLRMDPKNSGDYIMIQCPYHKNGQERHPSAQLKKSDGWFWCFNCKESHSFYDFLSHCLNTNGKEWLLRNFSSVDIDERHVKFFDTKKEKKEIHYIDKEVLKQYRFTHPYMFERKLDLETIRKYDIGYDKENDCITFPNKDPNGNILFIATRNVNKKYFHYPEGVDKPVYGLYELYRELKKGKPLGPVYVVESMLDALYIVRMNKFAIALNGLGTPYQYDIIRKSPIRQLILATDNDNAGKAAREKFRANVTNKFIQEISYESYGKCKDINEMTEDQFLNAKII